MEVKEMEQMISRTLEKMPERRQQIFRMHRRHNEEEMATIICRVMGLASVEKEGVIRIVNSE